MIDTAHSRKVQRAMEQELRRSMKGLKVPGHPRPFYLSYQLMTAEGLDVWGRYGAVFNAEPLKYHELYAEVRVGSHAFDQTVDGSLHTDFVDRDSYNWLGAPQDLDPTALRYALWKLTQLKYWESIQEYYDKKKIMVDQRLKKDAPSFSKESKVVKNQAIQPATWPKRRWEEFIRRSSELFKGYKNLVDPYVRIRGISKVRIFVNSEGTKYITQDDYYEVLIASWTLTKEGVYLNASEAFHTRDPNALPSHKQMAAAVDRVAKDLGSLAKAEPMEPYAGPALLSGLATGLIFHEAIGHRLEGERMISRTEGQTFAGKIGQQILPKGVDLIDDPSLRRWEEHDLFGHYTVDDEGVPARPVKLVEDGVLQTFLMSRACTRNFKQSNGHGRHERYQDPMARMANLIVKAEQRHSWDELKTMLLAEVERRRLPHGIIVKDVSSGETRTDHYDFQAFKGVPTAVYSVDPKTGKETRVRDVNFIGTPLAAIQRIKAFGKDYQVDNSYCFAESGSVPVSTIAPSMLVDELELQRATTRYFRPPILSFPPLDRKANPKAK